MLTVSTLPPSRAARPGPGPARTTRSRSRGARGRLVGCRDRRRRDRGCGRVARRRVARPARRARRAGRHRVGHLLTLVAPDPRRAALPRAVPVRGRRSSRSPNAPGCSASRPHLVRLQDSCSRCTAGRWSPARSTARGCCCTTSSARRARAVCIATWARGGTLEYAPALRPAGSARRARLPRRDGGRRAVHAGRRPHGAVTSARRRSPGSGRRADPRRRRGSPGFVHAICVTAHDWRSARRRVLDATGVWASRPDRPFGGGSFTVLPSRGSHLVVPRERLPVRGGITLRVPGKVVFLVPWPRHWVIGTTDAPYRGAGRPPVGERRRGRRDHRHREPGDGRGPDAERCGGHLRRPAAADRARPRRAPRSRSVAATRSPSTPTGSCA